MNQVIKIMGIKNNIFWINIDKIALLAEREYDNQKYCEIQVEGQIICILESEMRKLKNILLETSIIKDKNDYSDLDFKNKEKLAKIILKNGKLDPDIKLSMIEDIFNESKYGK